jgi:hypothetical protein
VSLKDEINIDRKHSVAAVINWNKLDCRVISGALVETPSLLVLIHQLNIVTSWFGKGRWHTYALKEYKYTA